MTGIRKKLARKIFWASLLLFFLACLVPLLILYLEKSPFRHWVLIFLVLGVFANMLLSSYWKRLISFRLEKVTKALQTLRRGEPLEPLAIHEDDEIGLLEHAFNQLQAVLRTRDEDIRTEKNQLAALLDNLSEGVIGVDRCQRVLMANTRAETILKIPKGRGSGKSLLEAVKHPGIDEMMERAIRLRSQEILECRLSHLPGRTLKMTATGIASPKSEISGILVFYDVTKIRDLENMRRDFVANVSHELKTPLPSIKGFMETLLGGALRDPAHAEKFLRMMQEDTQRLSRLIDELLELSKIESHEMPLKIEALDLKEELRKVLGMLELRFTEKKIAVENRIADSNLPSVRADRDRLQQVLVNLLDNAVKFSKAGGQVRLDARVQGSRLEIAIEDTGLGIPEKDIPRVFERFFRVDKARSREEGGTGLGLAIVKHIVEAHGGSVSCESRLDRGSKFSFTIPV